MGGGGMIGGYPMMGGMMGGLMGGADGWRHDGRFPKMGGGGMMAGGMMAGLYPSGPMTAGWGVPGIPWGAGFNFRSSLMA